MEQLPDSVQARLDQLSTRFREGLPDRLRELQSLTETAEQGDVERIRDVRMRVHRIAGSASSFGMEALTETARNAEGFLERDLAREPQELTDETRSAIAAIEHVTTGVVMAADARPNRDDPGSTGPEPELDENRVIVVVGPTDGLPADFGDQVAAFGLAVQMVDGFAAVQTRMEDLQSRAASQEITLVLLMRVEFLSTDLSRLQQYKALRDQWPDCIRTVMVGSEDDFTTRLKSVRYGADAFLADPLDVTQLVDRLDSLVHGEQATPYHVLIVDDDPEQVSMTALTLQQAGMITSVVTDPSNIFKVMVEQKPELILMDMYMPQCSGAELAAIIRQSDSFVSIPIVFLSVETNAAKQLDAIRSGADDFLVKPIDPEHLVTSVRIRAARTRAMRFFMERDSLTGLLNHTNLKQRLETELQRARRIGTELSFAMIDLDRFKSVNDTYGHLTGDHVLKSLARLLEERLRRTDIIGRYGGEEFGVILFGTSAERARQIMDEIRRSFSRIRQNAGTVEFTVTLSCGIAEYPTFEHAAEIGERADGALYQAKEQGRNRVVIATDSM